MVKYGTNTSVYNNIPTVQKIRSQKDVGNFILKHIQAEWYEIQYFKKTAKLSSMTESASIPHRRHLWLQFLHKQVLSYFNIFNLHLVFLTLPIYNLMIVSLQSPARSQPTFDNLIQFHIVTMITKYMGSHSVDTIVLYFALHSKYCNSGLMMVFRRKHVAIFKYR